MMAGIAVNCSNWTLTYLGWSGFHLQRPDGPDIFIDPPKATVFPVKSAVIIFITHGHPEHLGGTIDLMAGSGGGQGITIIGSKVVCRYLAQQRRGDAVHLTAVDAGQKIALAAEISFEVFPWRHMPLLPPGFGPAARHILSIMREFRGAWHIIKMSLKGPKGPGSMLGYQLRLPGDATIIIYGEGLHRRCCAEDVVACAGATLLVAAEPEDCAQLPRLVAASGAVKAILYEPHRQWRDLFSLPHADMKALGKEMEEMGIVTEIAGVEHQHKGAPLII